ncbi:hypothetical protein [Roseicyclus mahoneyensis]|uniref:Uncharacterized protein n=1 Tax=Roseicyclus mahoneyensis TaxID=164332 RepID=A0A316GJE0_9RHOB|nr:hypothetical protein [Roseicyclus mahoneyensis]PWK60377.1 hypothetical protein C7455_10413 [Roseicyclus mahoneyensis]
MQIQTLPDSPQTVIHEADQIGIQIVFCDTQGRPRSSRCVRLAAYLRTLAPLGERPA